MKELSEKLLSVIETAEPRLREITALESSKPILSGGWSRKQVIAHLIDSASNNHQRFVRAALQAFLEFPNYDQEGNIRVQAPQEADWLLLVSLWAAYNRYLAHILAHLPASKLATPCRIGSRDPVSLESVATDYVTHLVHHLSQIGAADAT
ncbi:MAG TPA: DinB family protein [Candidatus Sulfotelmatobacter sp.]